MKIVIEGHSICTLIIIGFLSAQLSAWWMAAAPLIVMTWFAHPRWDKKHGWRWRHD